ncbi:DUF4236 domain-containing protein [Deinococcus cavernae]|uniref:DUF4236 domain-containing protein n=1 Tax=Deinococcus cavernae TaxID=2320857 RepID=A0A418V5T8_9DEIO|nr:DUF4236 domain-containing protein [Deinococcus cavernae]RJF71375.1 DUF4236 domain-containing protein [Deinococcus cavernae]
MGLYFRKSFKAGPMRFTFSKSGISTSVGVKGARLTSGPRGTYITIGGGGISYRQRIGQTADKPLTSDQSFPIPQQTQSFETQYDPTDPFAIKTADISELVRASDNSVLQEINERMQLPAFGGWIYGVTALVFFVFGGFGFPLAWVLGITGIVLGAYVSKGDKENKTTPLFYQLDDQASQNFEKLISSLNNLASTQKIWRINTQQGNSDWKRNAGASMLLKRASATVLKGNPPFIRTNLEVVGIHAGNFEIYFLPDHILVRQQGQYAALEYKSLDISTFETSFIEDGSVPKDAQLIRHTWQYVNKSGDPDKRFKNNRQLPVMRYGELNIKSSSGLNSIFHVSNLEAAKDFSSDFNYLQKQKAFNYKEEVII